MKLVKCDLGVTSGILIPLNGDPEAMIDRYDGRALMDFIVEPRRCPNPQPTASEAELLEARTL